MTDYDDTKAGQMKPLYIILAIMGVLALPFAIIVWFTWIGHWYCWLQSTSWSCQ